nr:hypothetical protein Iba_scaffold11704CG0030 [Ipomoea batatas]GME21535.1 hypothetical protein Iba_scaffold28153CG0010 [Ipomoea batatas]
MLRSFDLFGKTKLLGGGRVTVDSGIQKDVEASCSQDSFWCNSKNIATMDVAILRSEQYLKKFDAMPSFSLGLTPPLGEESNWDNVVNISSQYQDVRAKFTQACSPSSHHQEDEQMEVCEEDILTTLSQFDPSPSGGVRPRLKLGISSNVFKYCSLLKMATSIVAIFFELHQNESWLQDASTSF